MINSETYDTAMSSESADLANQQKNSLVDLRSQNNNIATSTDDQQPTSLGTFGFGSVGLNKSSTGFAAAAPSTGSLFGSTSSFGFGNRMSQSCLPQPLFNVIEIVVFN